MDPITNYRASVGGAGRPARSSGEVYQMVASLKPNHSGSLPGGALPAAPFATGLEVYQMVGAVSQGQGVLPGGALVATPFFPGV